MWCARLIRHAAIQKGQAGIDLSLVGGVLPCLAPTAPHRLK
jgi:hypothetical protein